MSFQNKQHNRLIKCFNKTRLAPTPSGFLHLGNAYSFLLTQKLAKQYGAKILLRIDDLDRERTHEHYVQDIFDTLNFLKIEWDEGARNAKEFEQKFSQLYRLELYNNALQKLKESGKVFACSCSRTKVLQDSLNGVYAGTCRQKNISLDEKDVCWRLNTEEENEIRVNGLNGEQIKTTLPPLMKDFIVRKKDGFPAYQLSSLVDDVFYNVDLIVRGEDLYDSTLAQLYLACILHEENFLNVTFHHHKVLTNNKGGKLSKSAGDTSIRFLREQGKSIEDVFTLLSANNKNEF